MRTSTGFRHRATALTLLVALFIILGGASQPLFVSAQIKKTTVTFTFSPSKGYIDPGVNQSSTVFTGTVTVKGIPLIVTSVNITADTGSWTNNSNPTSLVITGPK